MATQSIIVYRNPGEEALWNILMDGNSFPYMVAVAVFFIVFVAFNKYVGGRYHRNQVWYRSDNFGAAVALAAAVAVVFIM